MRILDLNTSDDLAEALRKEEHVDYVYSYPPRQAYRPFTDDPLPAIRESLATQLPLNLYFHVPFCRQICYYCNLYAVSGSSESRTAYVDALVAELRIRALTAGHRTVDTLYIGGGTPSLLPPQQLGRLIDEASKLFSTSSDRIGEVALEVAPETFDEDYARRIRDFGILRINLGIQALNDAQIRAIGRRHETAVQHNALGVAMEAGFRNVCVDLIYGLPAQDEVSWERGLRDILEYRPQTICCYPLTLRPATGYSARGLTEVQSSYLYRCYDIAVEILSAAGYVQETHVRWVEPGIGGYVQKQNHWNGDDVLGVGAGARSYLRLLDARNGYSVRHRRQPLDDYMDKVRGGQPTWTDGFVMTDDERSRKAAILRLGNLERGIFETQFGADIVEKFPIQIEALQEHGLLSVSADRVSLTDRGQRHRDVAVQMFFSGLVRDLVLSHSYDE